MRFFKEYKQQADGLNFDEHPSWDLSLQGRKKFEKATMRRKGQVTEVRRPAGPYGGEKTGIKSRVTKSTRF